MKHVQSAHLVYITRSITIMADTEALNGRGNLLVISKKGYQLTFFFTKLRFLKTFFMYEEVEISPIPPLYLPLSQNKYTQIHTNPVSVIILSNITLIRNYPRRNQQDISFYHFRNYYLVGIYI